MVGPPDTGKTHLGVALAASVAARTDRDAFFADSVCMVASSLLSMQECADCGTATAPFVDLDLLIIDDLHDAPCDPLAMIMLAAIFQERAHACRPTVALSALPLPSLLSLWSNTPVVIQRQAACDIGSMILAGSTIVPLVSASWPQKGAAHELQHCPHNRPLG